MAFSNESIVKFTAKYLPRHVVGEIMTKRWVDNAVPFLALVLVVLICGSLVPDFYSASSVTDLGRQVAEFGLVVLALTIVMISGGGLHLSASVFSLSVLLALVGINVNEWPVPLALAAVLAMGAACGAINGDPDRLFAAACASRCPRFGSRMEPAE